MEKGREGKEMKRKERKGKERRGEEGKWEDNINEVEMKGVRKWEQRRLEAERNNEEWRMASGWIRKQKRTEEEMGGCRCTVISQHFSRLKTDSCVFLQLFISRQTHTFSLLLPSVSSTHTHTHTHIFTLGKKHSPPGLGRWCTCCSCHTWSQTERGSPSHSTGSRPCRGQKDKRSLWVNLKALCNCSTVIYPATHCFF